MTFSLKILLSAAAVFSMVNTAPREETITLPGDRLFPEGIAASSDGRIFVGSFIDGTIIETNRSGETSIFAEAGENGLVSVVGLMVDEKANLLYACSSDPGVANLTGAATPAVSVFDLTTSEAVARYELPGGGFCNDMTQTPDGSIYITDSFNPRVLKLDPSKDAISVWLEDELFTGEGFNLNGIAYQNGALYTVKYNSGQLFKINFDGNGSAGLIEVLETSRQLQNPDGLIASSWNELLVVEGSGQVSTICVKDHFGEVNSVSEKLNVPTSVALLNGLGYVVQSQFDHLFNPEVAKTAPDAFSIQVINVK
ncbi:MAG: hypothetical protein MRY59_07185 [Aquisalinus sp.]|nr:hypothetical protein [Aquisalinus sp.]